MRVDRDVCGGGRECRAGKRGLSPIVMHGDALWGKIIKDAEEQTKKPVSDTCFVAGTLVHTREGLVPIEKIKVGDYVLSKPESGEGEVEYKRVVQTFEHDEQEVWYVRYSLTGSNLEKNMGGPEGGFVVVTGNHPFWLVAENEETPRAKARNAWVRADQMCYGMSLLLCDGRIAVVREVTKLMRMTIPHMGWREPEDDCVGDVVDFSGKCPKEARGPIGEYPYLHPVEWGVFDSFYKNEGVDWSSRGDDVWLKRKVYNIEVEDHHTYFVDELGVWVHNKLRRINMFHDQKQYESYVAKLKAEGKNLVDIAVVQDGVVKSGTDHVFCSG